MVRRDRSPAERYSAAARGEGHAGAPEFQRTTAEVTALRLGFLAPPRRRGPGGDGVVTSTKCSDAWRRAAARAFALKAGGASAGAFFLVRALISP